MNKIRKYTNRVEAFLHSDAGQRFFNIAYSVGAAIVIWGALFKILHIQGGNALLCVGMGTEIIMFILTAFDRPPKDPDWDEIVPALKSAGNTQALEGLTIIDDTDNKVSENGSYKKDFNLPDTDKIEGASEKFSETMEDVTSSLKILQEETEKMNRNMKEMNEVYDRMLKAMHNSPK